MTNLFEVIKNETSTKSVIYFNIDSANSHNGEERVVVTSASNLNDTIDMLSHAKTGDKVSYVSFNSQELTNYNVKEIVLTCSSRFTPVRINGEMFKKASLADALLKGYELTSDSDILSRYVFIMSKRVPIELSREELVSTLASKGISESMIEKYMNMANQRLENSVESATTLYGSVKVQNINEIAFQKGITLVKAPTGFGKTTRIVNHAKEQIKANRNARISIIVPLRSIVSKVVSDIKEAGIKVATYNSSTAEIINSNVFICCINSCYKNRNAQIIKSSDFMFVDEAESVVKNIIDDSLISDDDEREEVINSFAEFCQEVKSVVFFDADLTTSVSGQFVSQFVGAKYKAFEVESKSLYSSINAKVISRNKLMLDKQKLEEAKVIVTDSKKIIAKVLKILGYKCHQQALENGVLVLHKDISNFDAQSAFRLNPNSESCAYRKIIMSPLVQRGLSVTTEYTDNVLVICSETLSPNDMIQLSRRFRTAKNIEFACEVSESRNNYFDFTTGKNDYISFTAGLLKNQQNTFKTNYPMAMTLTLQKVGFNVIQESISSEEAEDNKLLNRANDIAFKKEEVKNTANARNITKEENDKIVEESKMTKDDEYAHEKFKVAKFLKIKTSDVDEEAVRFKSKFNLKSIVRLAAMDDAANPKSSDEDKARKSVAKVFSHAGITFDSDMTVRVAMKDDTDGVNYKDIYSAIHDERDNLGFIGFSTKSDKLKATDRQMSRFVFDFLKSCGIETSRKDSGKAYELNWHKYAVTALKLSEAKEEVLFEDVA